LDFLLDNPFIIIVLIGIISSLFKKGKEVPDPKKRKPKPFVESIPLPKDIVKEIRQEAAKYMKPFEQEQPVQTLQSEYNEVRKKAAEQPPAKSPVLEESYSGMMHTPFAQEIGDIPLQAESREGLAVDKKKLADAVIWAEILGPPRSKKPHRTMNFRS